MVILGLILVLIAVAIGAALLLGTQTPEVSGQEVDIRLLDAVTINLNPLTLVIAVMLTMRRTVALGLRMCTGLAAPSRIDRPSAALCWDR